MIDLITRIFSPYEFNPLNINPLREVLTATVDFELLRSPDCPIKLFLCTSNVRTGKIKVFERDTICVDRVMASACLPQLFQAVEIDGEHYWDGGYMGNPAMFPLIYSCTSRDIILIRINPLSRHQLPRTAAQILNRINEISFNSSLMREMRVMNFVTGLIDSGQLSEAPFRRLLVHSISADQEMAKLGATSKLNADMHFLERLRDVGRRHAEGWLADKFDSLDRESTIELQKEFL
jgi:NTE family protein